MIRRYGILSGLEIRGGSLLFSPPIVSFRWRLFTWFYLGLDLSTRWAHTSLTEKVDRKNRQNPRERFSSSFDYCFNSSVDYCFHSSFDSYFDPSVDDYFHSSFDIAFIYHFRNHVWWLGAKNAPELIGHKLETEKYMLTMFWSTLGPLFEKCAPTNASCKSTYFSEVILSNFANIVFPDQTGSYKQWIYLRADNARPNNSIRSLQCIEDSKFKQCPIPILHIYQMLHRATFIFSELWRNGCKLAMVGHSKNRETISTRTRMENPRKNVKWEECVKEWLANTNFDLGNVNIFSQLPYPWCRLGIKTEREYAGSAILYHFLSDKIDGEIWRFMHFTALKYEFFVPVEIKFQIPGILSCGAVSLVLFLNQFRIALRGSSALSRG
jgi:hypothetical protein